MSVGTRVLRESGFAILSGTLALVLAVRAIGATWADLSVAWGDGDVLPVYSYAENMSRGNWFLANPDLGYPGFQDHGHFPVTDLVSIAQIGVLAQVLPSPLMAVNLFTLGTFFTAAATFYLAARFVGVGTFVSVVISVAFSILPWHFTRAAGHLFLASYMSVGLAVFLVAIVARRQLDRPHSPWLLSAGLAAAVLIGANGVYYALITTVLLAVVLVFGTVGAGWVWPRWRTLLVSATVPLTVAFAVVINRVSISTPATAENVVRSPSEAYLYGGNLATLFFPASNTESGQRLSGILNLGFPNLGGEGDALLSSAAVAAVLVSSWMVALRWATTGPPAAGSAAGMSSFWPGLFVLLIAFSVTGGLGALFSHWVSSDIRAWGRYSIFVVGVAFLIAGLVMTAPLRGGSRSGRLVAIMASCGLGLLAVLDISGDGYRFAFAQFEARDAELRSLVGSIEGRKDDGCPILELPLSSYPEEGGVNRMAQYSHLLPYVYSEDLRWSYGAFKATPQGDWSMDARDDPSVLLDRAQGAGFCGILVDTWAFANPSESVDEAAAFGDPESVSSTGRWAYFDLTGPLPGEVAFQPASGSVVATNPVALPVAWWIVDDIAAIAVQGEPDADVVVDLELSSPPCGPVAVSLDGRQVAVDGVNREATPVKLDENGRGAIVIATEAEACAVEGEEQGVRLGLNAEPWIP